MALVPPVVTAVGGSSIVKTLVAMLAASLASEVALLPVSAALFNRVTFAGLALNFVAIPLMSVAQVGGMVVVGLQGAWPPAAHVTAWIPQLAADWLIESASLVAWAPWTTWRVPAPPAWAIAGYYGALVAGLAREGVVAEACAGASRARSGVAVGTAAIGLASAGWVARRTRARLRGVAAARPPHRSWRWTSVRGTRRSSGCRAVETILVDAGGLGGGARFDVGERVVVPAAWALGVRRLHAFVATHGDVDHVGGGAAAATMVAAGRGVGRACRCRAIRRWRRSSPRRRQPESRGAR